MAKRFITAFAEAGDRAAMPDIPTGTDSNYQTGYPSQYEEDPIVNPVTAKFVERDKSNQLYNDITANIKEWQEHLYPAFITSAVNGGVPFSYSKGSIVSSGGVDFVSNVDSNEDVPPSAKWGVYLAISTEKSDSRYTPVFKSVADMVTNVDSIIYVVDLALKVQGEDGAVTNYTVVTAGSAPDVFLTGSLWARPLGINIPKVNAAGFSDPIINAPLQGGTTQKWFADFFAQNFVLGDGGGSLNAGASGSKDGSNNQFMGLGVGINATSAFACAGGGFNSLNLLTIGDSITTWGYQSGARATTAKNGVFVGTDAGFNVTTAINVVAVGRHVFFDGTSSSDMTVGNIAAIGTDIGLNATTMQDMCIMGTFAQQEGTISARAVVIGQIAAQDANEIKDSVVIGRNVVSNVTSIINNTVEIGVRVNENALTAATNAIIGQNAFFTLATGVSATTENVGVGSQAYSGIYGVQNTGIGTRVGARAADTNLSRTVLIGYRAGDGTAIDDDFIIANSTLSATELIKGNFSTKAMRIEATALTFRNIPVVGTGASGTIWNDSGTVKIVP